MKEISISKQEEFSKSFNGDRANVIASNAAFHNGLLEAATDYREVSKLPLTFTIDLKQGDITNQRASGRCWIFSALNTFRYEIIHKYNLKTFELSQNYMFFYDKLEKSNYFLESILSTTDEPVDGRLISFLYQDPLGDGGQWDMLANLVMKYGVVPVSAYPDSANAKTSRWMDEYLTSKLREDATELRNAKIAGKSEEELADMKSRMMEEVYRILAITLGEPPKSFDLTLHVKNDKRKDDKNKKDGKDSKKEKNENDDVIQEFGITPVEFFKKYVGIDLKKRVSLINAPDRPYDTMYTVKYLGNVIEGNPVAYLNLEMDVIKKAVIAQLKDGHPVWFGSDCMKFSARKEGVFDRKSMDIEGIFNIEYHFTKADRLKYYDSAMNHAMVINGVNLDKNGKPDRWKIENSWGDDAGIKGYYVASDSWFDEFVYQAVVDKKYLDKETRKLFKKEMVGLEPWDPMGSLA